MQTIRKLNCQPPICALDRNVSLNVTSQKSGISDGDEPKTTVNGINSLRDDWKTNGQGRRVNVNPALTNAKGPRMADSFPKRILPDLEGKIGELRKLRFWSKVDIRGANDCWDWQSSLNTSGYGRFKIASYKTVIASRFALISETGQEPIGMLVLHSCDRPRCCNPNHLRFGTVADNNQDKTKRGRNRGSDQKGFANTGVKISQTELEQIIAGLKERKNNCEIAQEIGTVGHAMVSRIRVGKSWQAEAAALGWNPA